MESTSSVRSRSDSVKKAATSSNMHAIARGAFSELMLRPTESVCSLASSTSGYEYIPDRVHQVMDTTNANRGDASSSRWVPSPPRSMGIARSTAQEIKQRTRISSEKLRSLPREALPRPSSVGAAHNGEDEIDFHPPRPAAPINLPSHIGLNPVPGMSTNVHPIEVLTKKLREQATELTHAYEEIEKKNALIAEFKAQVHQQQQTIDRRQSGSSSPAGKGARSSGKSVTATGTDRVRQRKMSDLSTSKKSEELAKKIVEAEQEKKKYELATKRIEKTLVDLQVFRNEYDPSLHPKKTTQDKKKNAKDEVRQERDQDALLLEQKHYIRILEELVHLKASEFQIAGHEELLMVLAELRHTIYQQEQELAQKTDSLQENQRLLDEQRSANLDLEKHLESNSEARDQEQQTHHVLKEKLSLELDQLRRQLRHEQERFHQLKSTSDATQHKLQEMQGKWIEATQVRSLLESKHEEDIRQCQSLKAQLDELKAKCEQNAVLTADLEGKDLKREAYLIELKSVQDDLLQTIDSHTKKANESKTLIKRLRAQVHDLTEREQLMVKLNQETAQAQEMEVFRLRDQVSGLQQQVKSLETQIGNLLDRSAKLEAQLSQQNQNMDALIQEKAQQEEATNQHASEQKQKWNDMQEALTEMQAAMQTSLEMMGVPTACSDGKEVNVTASTDDTDEFTSDLVDQDKLDAMRACCRSINHLVSKQEKLATQFQSYLPSLGELMKHVSDVAETMLDHVQSVMASWSRERCDLLHASEELESTTKICHRNMEKAQATALHNQKALAEVSEELTKQVLRVQDMEHELDDAYSEIQQLQGVQERLIEQERAVAVHQDRLEQLATQNQELVALNTTYILERAALDQQIQLMNAKIHTLQDCEHRVQELEQDMMQASHVMEQQNEWTKQLQLELEEHEQEHESLTDQLSSLTSRDQAVSSSFCHLFQQYLACVRSSSRHKGAVGSDDESDMPRTVFEQEDERGDLLCMMQVFPALVEEYISTVVVPTIQDTRPVVSIQQKPPAILRERAQDGKARRQRDCMAGIDTSKAAESSYENIDSSLRYCQPTPPRRIALPGKPRQSRTEVSKASVPVQETEDVEFAKQLQLVQSAFLQYQ